jgi:hypothetical protein
MPEPMLFSVPCVKCQTGRAMVRYRPKSAARVVTGRREMSAAARVCADYRPRGYRPRDMYGRRLPKWS